MEIPSGVRIKAMRPSRGGRLIVTPRAMKALQVDCGPAVPGVPEGNRTGDNSETQMGPARSARAGIRRAPGLTFPFGRARLLGIRLVVFSGVFEPRDLVGEGILETYERILHAQRGLSLCKAHLMLGYPQRLKHSIFVVAGERDPVVATALLDRLLHHAVVVQIEGSSHRLRQHADLLAQPRHPSQATTSDVPPRRRGRPPKVVVAAT